MSGQLLLTLNNFNMSKRESLVAMRFQLSTIMSAIKDRIRKIDTQLNPKLQSAERKHRRHGFVEKVIDVDDE